MRPDVLKGQHLHEPPPAWDEMVLVGRIVRTHGLAGHVVINPETDFPEERFGIGSRMWAGRGDAAAVLVVTASRLQNGRPVVAFDGIASATDAERLLGWDLRIPEADLVPLGEGTYYHHQLVGCTVRTVSNVPVGEVVRVDGGGGAGGSLLVVAHAGGEVLIPLTASICPDIDVAARRIVVAPPEGLLDLNAPGQERKRKRPRRHQG